MPHKDACLHPASSLSAQRLKAYDDDVEHMDHPPPHNIVPHYRLLLHGKDGCIPYLTPELIRLLFCPPLDCDNSNKDSSSNNTNVDWKWRRQHFILGVAVKDTCISALYRTVKTTPPLVTKTKRTKEQAINENNGTKRMKKEKQQLQDDDVSTTQVVGGLDSEILSSPHFNNDHMNTNSTIDEDPLQGKQEMGVIKKPCGYSFITPSQSNQICSNIHSHRVNSCKNGDETAVPHCYDNYMHTHLRIPRYISTMIVPTFSLDQPSNNSHVHNNNDDDSSVSNHRNNGGHVSKKQPPPQTAVNARKQKKQQQQQQHKKNDDGSSIIPNSTKECISVDTPHGWQKLTPIQYWDAVMSLINPIPSSVKGEIDDASSATSSSSSSSLSSCVGAVGLFDHFGLSRNRINDVIFAVEESSNDDVVKANDNNDNDINDNNKPSSAHHPFAGKCGTLLQRVVQRTNGWSHCITSYRDTATTTDMTPVIEFWTPVHLTASRLPLDYLLSCPRNVHNIKSDVKSQASILSNCCNVAIVGWDADSYSRERKRQALHDLISTLRSLSSPPRQYAVLSVNNLHSILDAVKKGVSIIGTDIVRHWSCSGKALCLDLTRYNNNDDGPQDVTSVDKRTGGLLDLKGEQYAQDARVLIPGCKYIVGPSFSRAYIHHLIKAKEMLAEILLFVHNLNQMLLLMRQLSKSVDDNNLETYCHWIEDQL